MPSALRFGALALLSALAIALGGCDNQGEGELCSLNLSSSDCNSGLVCVKSNLVSDPSYCPNCYGACCPVNGQSSAAACSQNALIDASATPTMGDDGGGEASSEASSEASGDDGAAADGPSE